MRAIVRRSLLPVAVASIILALSGCSAGSSSYASPEALRDAYVDAGGACEKSMEADESMLAEGAHGLVCSDPMVFLIVFDDEDAKTRYLASTGAGSGDKYQVGGERWIATSLDGEGKDVLDKLGGKPLE